MKNSRWVIFLVVLWALLTVPLLALGQSDALPESPVGRCVNLGNTLEAANEGEWGLTAEPAFFEAMADIGFDTVRLPVRWSAHMMEEPPYTLDEAFFDRVDEVIGWAFENELKVILTNFHYYAMNDAPDETEPGLIALWEQVAAHYADSPAELIFELLNMPTDELTPERWNEMLPGLVATIRETNPERQIIVGGGLQNSIEGLLMLELPEDDNLIAAFIYFEPRTFTFQGAQWIDGMDEHVGTTWGTPDEVSELSSQFEQAADWGEQTGVPLMLAEFGSYSLADMESRILWTQTARENAELHGMGWCYWEFAAGFGIYNPANGEVNALAEALIPTD